MTLPKHIAIIMDGNRRWAQKNKKKALFGHRYAAETTIEPIIDRARQLGIPYLTLWAFSTENWRRDPQEVQGLLQIFRDGLKDQGKKFIQKKIRLNVIGDYTAFPQDIVELTNYYLKKTAGFTDLTVTFALNYGGRDEIIRAIGKLYQHQPNILDQIKTSNWQTRKQIAQTIAKYLDTHKMPDPDMIIRTGGEKRLSGYLLWQIEYAELFFTPTLWPDFTPEELDNLLDEYKNRHRRFGK
ncbi:MAG: di-trans,poly-cis-decaprenylcistransferase [bacterium]|nr:di-trans,poly-cis-decaprenylcistransferase [bacterium]